MADRKPSIAKLVVYGGPEAQQQVPAVIAAITPVDNPAEDRGECLLMVLDPYRGIHKVHAYFSVEPQGMHWSWPKELN